MRAMFAALLLAGCVQSSAENAPIPEQWIGLEVTATPIALGVEQVGRLRFRGGLVLSSNVTAFGALSGFEVLDNNRALFLNDDAEWFEATLVLDGSGALTGFADVRYALMRDERGDLFSYEDNTADSEGLTQLLDGRFAASFEGTQSVRIFDMNRDGPFGPSTFGPRLAETRALPKNAGLEAIATMADGSLLVGAEGSGLSSTPIWRVPLGATEPTPPLIQFPLAPGYSLTALDRAPDGGFIALERFYAPIIGARAKIAYFPASALDSDADVIPDVQELATLAPPMAIDNFEGVATALMPDGTTRIYVVSDDNYNRRQRTILYAFDVVSDAR
jgi:hypothetical protein